MKKLLFATIAFVGLTLVSSLGTKADMVVVAHDEIFDHTTPSFRATHSVTIPMSDIDTTQPIYISVKNSSVDKTENIEINAIQQYVGTWQVEYQNVFSEDVTCGQSVKLSPLSITPISGETLGTELEIDWSVGSGEPGIDKAELVVTQMESYTDPYTPGIKF